MRSSSPARLWVSFLTHFHIRPQGPKLNGSVDSHNQPQMQQSCIGLLNCFVCQPALPACTLHQGISELTQM